MEQFISPELLNNIFSDSSFEKLYNSAKLVRKLVAKQSVFQISRYQKLYQESQGSLDCFKLGIIGLGQVGTCVLEEVLDLELVPSSQIMVSTRSPENYSQFLERGIQIFWDNSRVAKECDYIVLSVLPHQAESVCEDIGPVLNSKSKSIFSYTQEQQVPGTVLFSTLAATTVQKLKQLTYNYPFVLRCVLDAQVVNSLGSKNPLEEAFSQLTTVMPFSEEDFETLLSTYKNLVTREVQIEELFFEGPTQEKPFETLSEEFANKFLSFLTSIGAKN